jgi:hypothetical protein
MIETLRNIPSEAVKIRFENENFPLYSGIESVLKARGTPAEPTDEDILNLDRINAIRILEEFRNTYFQKVDAGFVSYSGADSFQPSIALDPHALVMSDINPFGQIHISPIKHIPIEVQIRKVLGNSALGNIDRDIPGEVLGVKPTGEEITRRLILAQHCLGRKALEGWAFSYNIDDGKLVFGRPGVHKAQNGIVLRVIKKDAPTDHIDATELRWVFHHQLKLPIDDEDFADNAISLQKELEFKNHLLRNISDEHNTVLFAKGTPHTDKALITAPDFINEYRAMPPPLQRGMIFQVHPARTDGDLDQHFTELRDMSEFTPVELDFTEHAAKFGNSPLADLWIHDAWLADHGITDEEGYLRAPLFPYHTLINPTTLTDRQSTLFKAARERRRLEASDSINYRNLITEIADIHRMNLTEAADQPYFDPFYLQAYLTSVSEQV